MKYILIASFIIFSLTERSFDNSVTKDDYVQIDTLEYCQEIIEEVNSIQLKCDTLLFEPFDEHEVIYYFKGIYFDENKRLRKYWRKEIVHDGSGECIDMSVYYDQDGHLVYIDIESSYHCGFDNEYFYVYKGHIIDYNYYGSCFCCDEEEEYDDESSEDKNPEVEDEEQWRPVVGDTLSITAGWGFSLRNFIHADSLIKILKKQDEYYYNEEFSD